MSNMRISGIASGMDTETMVRDLMKAQRMKADKFGQNKQLMLWRQEQYNNVNKDFANLILDIRKELELTKTTSSGTMYSNSMNNLTWVKKASSSNEEIFTASTTAAAPVGIHRMKVEQLAEGVSVASQSAVQTTKTVDGILAGKQATTATKLEAIGVESVNGQVSFEIKAMINGEEKNIAVNVEVNKDETIGDLVRRINNATGTHNGEKIPAGLQASFDSTTGRFFLSTKNTGESAQIMISSDDQELFTGADSKMNLPQIASGTGEVGDPYVYEPLLKVGIAQKGTNVKVSFNGAQNLEYSSNQFTINGIQIDLKKLPTNIADEFTIKVDTDVDGVYNKIKSFVDKYNELIEKMNGKVGEKRYRSYLPLTSDQKETLKEDEIKKWEEKAQSGLLANDGMINRTLQSMRNGLYDKFIGNDSSAKYNHLTSVGITTGDYKSKGKLEIDETKLKNAIMDDVDGVLNLFFAQYTPGSNDSALSKQELAKKTREGTGLLNRLFDDVVVGMKEIINKSGAGSNADIYRNVRSNILIDFVTGTSTGKGSISFLDDDIFKMEKTIADEERRMSRIEESYWKKFTAMEKALQSMNSQSSWLAQQLGSGR